LPVELHAIGKKILRGANGGGRGLGGPPWIRHCWGLQFYYKKIYEAERHRT
jgi:hypothetical protein